jgi:hypothetical protein
VTLLCVDLKNHAVVKLAMYSMSESLMSSRQAKYMLAKIDDESSKADFIGNMIVRNALCSRYAMNDVAPNQEKVVDKDEFAAEIDKLPSDIGNKLKADLKTILAFDPKNASGRYFLDLEQFADRTVLKKLMVCHSIVGTLFLVVIILCSGGECEREEISSSDSRG